MWPKRTSLYTFKLETKLDPQSPYVPNEFFPNEEITTLIESSVYFSWHSADIHVSVGRQFVHTALQNPLSRYEIKRRKTRYRNIPAKQNHDRQQRTQY